MITVIAALWVGAAVATWFARRRRLQRQSWLRSDVPAGIAYASLREEIDRRREEGSADAAD